MFVWQGPDTCLLIEHKLLDLSFSALNIHFPKFFFYLPCFPELGYWNLFWPFSAHLLASFLLGTCVEMIRRRYAYLRAIRKDFRNWCRSGGLIRWVFAAAAAVVCRRKPLTGLALLGARWSWLGDTMGAAPGPRPPSSISLHIPGARHQMESDPPVMAQWSQTFESAIDTGNTAACHHTRSSAADDTTPSSHYES